MALSCTSIVSPVQLQPKLIYIKKESVCMLLPLIHTHLLDQIIQSKAKSNQGCAFRKKSDSDLYFPYISHCRLNVCL